MKFFVNFLSAFRIAAAFAMIPVLMFQWYLCAFILFTLASLSDFFDGYLAIKYNAYSKLGGVMDHMGDKLLVAIALVLVAVFLQIWLVVIPICIMIARELYISGLREFMGTQKIEMPVPLKRMSMGKAKTTIQMVTLCVIFLWIWAVNMGANSVFIGHYVLYLGIAGLWLSTIASVWSAAEYTFDFAKKFKKLK